MGNIKSDFDRLYSNLMGKSPVKKGTAFEIIANAALSIMEEPEFVHDIHEKGVSGAHHQIDGLSVDRKTAVESKDHTISKRHPKVGLGEVQDFAGGLLDLSNVTEAYFASATSYTDDAKKYAEKSSDNSKPIILANVNISNEDDKKNRICNIKYNLKVLVGINFIPKFEKSEIERLFTENQIREDEFNIDIIEYYDENNSNPIKNSDLFNQIKGLANDKGCIQKKGSIRFNGKFYKYDRIEYEKKILTIENTISPNGQPVIKITYQNKNKLITDIELKEKINQLTILGKMLT